MISADHICASARFSEIRQARVYNLCDSYGYQTAGYYVSLLAAARGHRTMPSVATIQDMKSRSLLRADDELEELIGRSLHTIASKRFELSIYFGCNLAERHADLSRALFNLFPVPLMRASFSKSSTTGKWRPSSITPIPVGDLPASHGGFLREVIENHFARRGPAGRSGRSVKYEHDLAILANDEERSPPSNREALKRFERAARGQGFDVEFLDRDDYGRIAEFDALFIRETTNVNHHTYRFASRARAEGLVVIDDPESIIRCGNKVYLVELAKRLDLAIPPTMVVSSARTDEIIRDLGLPCVLKQPDSAFSEGVFRADTREELSAGLQRLLARSDLVIVQSFMPTRVRLARRRARPAAAVRLPLLHGRRPLADLPPRRASARRRASTRRSPCSTRPREVLAAGAARRRTRSATASTASTSRR